MKEGNITTKGAITDLLKLIFNLFLHYPKVCDALNDMTSICADSFYSSLTAKSRARKSQPQMLTTKLWVTTGAPGWTGELLLFKNPSVLLECFLSLFPPLLRAFHVNHPSLNPLEIPLPHVIHSLIIIPVLPVNRDLWFGKQTTASTLPDSASSSSAGSTNLDAPHSGFKDAKSRLFERASSVLSAGRRSLSRSLSRSGVPMFRDSALRAYELLDETLAYFMPGDISSDDSSIRSRLPEGETLEDLVSPLVVLITRFCLGDEDAKVRIRNWFIPPNLDRTNPLESRPDLLGRCLRLLSSIYHSRLNRVCGEMFFAMCDCDGESSISVVHRCG